jgi:4-amino-4-deoxychorismate lyase
MSAESAVSDGRADFGLIETLLWTREAGYWLLAGHEARLAHSAEELDFAFSREKWEAALARACAGAAAEQLRVRLELRRDGSFLTSAAPHAPDDREKAWRVALATRRFDSCDPLLRHKTTRRALYEEPLARARAENNADEILFLNERDEICEGARTNIFVEKDRLLLTPPSSCGLLPGVFRADLLARDEAREGILRLDDLRGGFFLGNSLRGLLRARLID